MASGWVDLRTGEILIGTSSGIMKTRTVRRKVEQDRWNAIEALAVRGTPWEPSPGIDASLIPAAVRRPPMVGEEQAVPPATERGLGARRTMLRRADCFKYGFTEGCPACKGIERDGESRRSHNEICRKRMESELMKTEEGRHRVEGGYGRVAEAALRVHEREERLRAEAAQPADEDKDGDGNLRKRTRIDPAVSGPAPGPAGSTAGLPPSTDEAGRRGSTITEDAAGTSPSRNPSVPQAFDMYTPPPAQAARGQKRETDGDDEDRYGDREEEVPDPVGVLPQPALPGNVFRPDESWIQPSSASSSMPVDGWTPACRTDMPPCSRPEARALESLEVEGRLQGMAVVREKLGCRNDLSEVYSPPRTVTVAQAAGLRGGFSLDLMAPDPDGYTWDFSKSRCRIKARELLRFQKPYLLIGSPPCTAYSNLQIWNRRRPGGDAKVDEAQRRARVHLVFCCALYREQIAAGRYFLHEHPKSATSWREPCMESLASEPTVMQMCIDQCAYRLVSKDGEGEAPAKKPTKFLTNSAALQQDLCKFCPGCKRHVNLVEGRAKAAQHYPKPLCRAVTRGIIEQARMDSRAVYSMVCQDVVDGMFEINHIEHEPETWKSYWDDVSGERLDEKLTMAARKEEIQGVHSMGV